MSKKLPVNKRYFPSGIATGEAFCNRDQLRAQLWTHIQEGTHTVIMAPRRYGKSSLMTQVLLENHCRYGWVDFLSCANESAVQDKLLKCIAELTERLTSGTSKLQKVLQHFFERMRPEIILGVAGQKVILHMDPQDAAHNISEALMQLDAYVHSLGLRVVLVLDEFQQLAQLPQAHALEANIRHAVERSQAITYLFSGSERHMLANMFGAHERPLYRLCHVLPVERIQPQDYEPFLQEAAQAHWGESLDKKAFDRLIELTSCHPFYVNALCQTLWRLPASPSQEDVDRLWHEYVHFHKSIITSEVGRLSLNQLQVLSTLALHPTKQPYAHEFMMKVKLSQSSLKLALQALLDKDLVYQKDGQYQVLDPGLRYYLANF